MPEMTCDIPEHLDKGSARAESLGVWHGTLALQRRGFR